MRRDCPCYELTDGCGCTCCTGENVSDNAISLPECVIPDEYPCECHSNEYLMLQAGIDPIAAQHAHGPYSHDTLVEAWRLK